MRLTEMFCAHLRIQDSEGSVIRYTYEIDRKLENNFTLLYRSDPNEDEDYWAGKFLRISYTNSLARQHISAYLGHFVVKLAKQIHGRMRNYQQYTQYQYGEDDIVQIGLSIAYDPEFLTEQLFSNFQQGRSPRNYLYKIIENKINETIRKQMGQSRLSKWGLLKYSTRTYVQKALQEMYMQQQVNERLLACDCFKEVYARQSPIGNRSLPPPTNLQLQEITNLYNQQTTPGTTNVAQTEQWMLQCIEALRNYQTIRVLPIDGLSGGEDSLPWSEKIPDLTSEPLEERSIMQELIPQLMAIVSEFLRQINPKIDNYLLLRYGIEATYREITPIFRVHYTNISRPCNQAQRSLLERLVQWADIKPDSEMLDQMNDALKDCLIHYYQDLIFSSMFQPVWQQLDAQSQNVLYLSYRWLNDEAAIARELQLDQSQVREKLETGTQELANAISKWMQRRLTVSSDLLNPLADKIRDLVQILVKKLPNSEF